MTLILVLFAMVLALGVVCSLYEDIAIRRQASRNYDMLMRTIQPRDTEEDES